MNQKPEALAGRRVLVTRPRQEAAALVQQLEAAGAAVIVAPTIQIVPPEDRRPLLDAAAHLSRFDWVVFASGNAVDALLAAVSEVGPGLGVESGGEAHVQFPKAAAVGSRTAARLQRHGIDAAVVPAEFRAEALVAAITADGSLSGTRVLVPRSAVGRDAIVEGLRAAGAHVTDVVAYRTVTERPDPDAPDVVRMLERGAIDAVTFTSGSAIRSFVQTHGIDAARLLHKTVVAVIGPVTAAVAGELDVPVHVQPETYTTEAMVAALVNHFRR